MVSRDDLIDIRLRQHTERRSLTKPTNAICWLKFVGSNVLAIFLTNPTVGTAKPLFLYADKFNLSHSCVNRLPSTHCQHADPTNKMSDLHKFVVWFCKWVLAVCFEFRYNAVVNVFDFDLSSISLGFLV